ncbi:serine/threonine-protein phosphatase 7 long form homolog [Solanum pennellii]|uniref:Serine/threonine-protein phosphatase 7 long form homolog n=1 Tax=Solanum pennellii TaxID=28526 RepID=A0ABM1H7M4_SOLPN|nr:serine/threonine-protein phosphatase 7 long form homolog [Solanum pennellii]
MEDPTIIERVELLVSPLGGIPQRRVAHFLDPIGTSIEGPNLIPHSIHFPFDQSEWPLKVTFHGCNGWRDQQKKWKEWVETMESIHRPVWIAAGIYGALKGSTYRVHTNENLIFGLVERWSCETNSFIFPWGEATVSLEDMMVLGGFSVLGDCVKSPLQSPELVEIEEYLENARRGLIGSKTNNQSRWLNYFMNSGKDYEHEAFLSLWLSRFVFPCKIGAPVFSLAVNLARGMRLALAPAVLASIYRDLGSLRKAMIETCGRNRDISEIHKLNLWSPLFFVQVWAWERMVSLQPECPQNYNIVSGVRIGRWHNVKQTGEINLRTTIDASGEIFLWRPYALAVEAGWSIFPKFYKENEEWTIVGGQNLDQGMESFVRCLRVSELVGLDCQEPYRPNRVAMQFGYDQDFPKWIPRSPSSPELAWYNYSRPIASDLRLYYPSRLFEPDVTTRYFKWWRNETDCQMENYPDVPPEHIAEETVHTSIDGNGSSSAGSMERSKASVVTATCTQITEGNMAMGNHEKESGTYDMIDIAKLERRIKNLENINSGKVPIFRTK